MKCPQCGKPVEQTFSTAIGVMCRDCCFTAASAQPGEFIIKAQPAVNVQMEIYARLGPKRPDYFFGPGKGGITCEPHRATIEEMQFRGKTMPIRQMKVFFMKKAAKLNPEMGHFELLPAQSFSCS